MSDLKKSVNPTIGAPGRDRTVRAASSALTKLRCSAGQLRRTLRPVRRAMLPLGHDRHLPRWANRFDTQKSKRTARPIRATRIRGSAHATWPALPASCSRRRRRGFRDRRRCRSQQPRRRHQTVRGRRIVPVARRSCRMRRRRSGSRRRACVECLRAISRCALGSPALKRPQKGPACTASLPPHAWLSAASALLLAATRRSD